MIQRARGGYRPVIGIPTQTLQAIDGIPEGLPHSWVMNQRYFHAITILGAVPWMIPLLDDDLDTLRQIYERLDGVLIPGGVDLDPATFGEERHPLCGRTDAARDVVELALARWALADGMPLLGLCRGAQVLNVAAGGSLYQDLAALYPNAIKHDYFPTEGYDRDYLAHEVDILPDTWLGRVLQPGRRRVNSMHHQGMCRLGAGLVPSAIAPDGLVEAVEHAEKPFAVGVQWHPEMLEMTEPDTRALFQQFLLCAADHAQGRQPVTSG